MKIICTQDNFKKAIYNTERVIGKQSTLPILENILLETEKGMLRVSATNLEIGVFLKIGAKIEREGKITIPAKLLSNFVNNLPAGDNIYLEVEGQLLKIKSGNYKANIKGLGAQDFPIIPELESEFLFSVPAKDFKEVIPKLLSCVSLDSTRPELGGVNVLLGEEKIALAATDSFRLLEAEVSLKKEKNENYSIFISKTNSLIIPASTLSEVFRSIAAETQEIKVAIEENQIFFQADNVRIISRLINGKYPEYKQIIPKEFITKTFINKEELLRAVKMASFFTNSKSGEINFKLDSKNHALDIMAQSEEKGENKAHIDIEIEGTDQEIVFNPRYFIDGINAIASPKVALLINSGSSPAVLRMTQEKNEKTEITSGFTYVVMPIKN
ncbi:MAG: DNA polymerase III subunit beta [bacterium]|nr:DNA polymerase III subunit beta [bacterium]